MVKTLLAALLSAAFIWLTPQSTPVNLNNSVQRAKADVSANAQAVQAATTEKVEQKALTEPQIVSEPEQAEVATPEPVVVETPHTPAPDTPDGIMEAAGIPLSDRAAVSYIVTHESNWSPTAVNPSSGSCGLVQELPCGKSGCTFGDGVCQLRWATSYATSRYGNWWSAQSFWAGSHWW